MKNILRKGFTVIELVMTIAILSVSTLLTTLVIVNVTNIQRASTDQYVYSKELKSVNDMANEFNSFVSLNNSAISFEYSSSTTSSLSFTSSGYLFTLSYNAKTLSISNNYDGEENYFKKSKSVTLDTIDDIVFSYNAPIGQLNLNVKINGLENHLGYVFRGEYDYPY